MANHKSAIKRNKQNIKRRLRNRMAKTTVRTAVKKTQQALEGGDLKSAQALLGVAERLIAKAAAKGIYHKRNAARKISRLSSSVAAKQRVSS